MERSISRKKFLKLAGAAGLGLTLPRRAYGEEPQMKTRSIPSSGEAMPVIGFGTWQTFDIGSDRAVRSERRQVLKILFDAGGRMVDSSPMYGRAEAVVGDLLAEMHARDRAFIATKVWTRGRQAGVDQIEESFRKFRTDRIDLMQVHNLVDFETHLKTLRALKDEGRIRYIGITHYTDGALDDLAAVMRAEPLDFVQLAYNLETQAAERTVLPLAKDKGVAVIVNRPFGGGNMFARARGKKLPEWAAELGIASWAQYFLKFILGHEAVTLAIPGTGNPRHAADNVRAGMGTMLDDAMRAKMLAHWRTL